MLRRWILVALVAVGAGGCSDALEQTSSAGQVVAFGNTRTLSLITAVGFSVTTVDLPVGDTYASLAGRGNVLLVFRSGSILNNSRVDVLDLARADTTAGFTFGGNSLSGAVQDDSIAWVALYDLGAVARVNYRTQVTSAIPVGGAPQAVAITAGRVFVVNGSGTASWVSAVDPASRSVVDSIPLTGAGASAVVVGGDSLLYVIEAGPPQGRVSIVDPVARQEVVVINGLSQTVGSPVYHPSGHLLIPAGPDGMLDVNTLDRSLTLGPGHGVKPDGHGVIALAIDNGGRVYAGDANCSLVHVLSGPPDYPKIRTVDVAGCPGTAATAIRP